MMSADQEYRAIQRVEILAQARRLASDWGYWCIHGQIGGPTGRKPKLSPPGWQRGYRPPPQWHPPEPRLPEANENSGLAVQKAYYMLPAFYRKILAAEYCFKPWVIAVSEDELDVAVARRARVSIGAYDITLERALLSLANVMKRKGLWGAQ